MARVSTCSASPGSCSGTRREPIQPTRGGASASSRCAQNQFGRLLLPLGLLMAAAAFGPAHRVRQRRDHVAAARPRRRREISIRFALGASRRDVIRQLVAEAAVLCALGACGGLLLAQHRARDAESLRARRHPAAAGGGHQPPDGALHERGAGRRHAARRPRARPRRAPHERLRGRLLRPAVRRTAGRPPVSATCSR